jgi:hypothetical protein
VNGTGCLTRIPVEREQAGSRHGGGEAMAGMPERPERFDRAEALHRLRDEQFDVLVVGGESQEPGSRSMPLPVD